MGKRVDNFFIHDNLYQKYVNPLIMKIKVNKMACKCGKNEGLSEEQKVILSTIAEINGPCACKDIAEKAGMESKAVSCKLTSLKNKGYIDSPARCKYAITAAGKAAL